MTPLPPDLRRHWRPEPEPACRCIDWRVCIVCLVLAVCIMAGACALAALRLVPGPAFLWLFVQCTHRARAMGMRQARSSAPGACTVPIAHRCPTPRALWFDGSAASGVSRLGSSRTCRRTASMSSRSGGGR